MFSLNQPIEFNKPELIIVVPSAGLSSNFAGDLLIKNNEFNKIGFFYSKYLSTITGLSNKGELIINGELFFNQKLNKLLLFLRSGIASNLMQKFFVEFNSLLQKYEITHITLFGSTSLGGFNTDFEVESRTVNVYSVSNDPSFTPEKYGIRSFNFLLNRDNKKALDELNYIEGGGFATKLIKLLNKNKLNYTLLLTFSAHLFDPLAGFALYYKYLNITGILQEEKKVMKLERFDEKLLKNENLNYDETWSFYFI
jgi:hypothetical protein